MNRLVLTWRLLEPPRTPVAVLAEGEAAPALAEAAYRRTAHGARLRVGVSRDVLLVLGSEADLPWVDGAAYLGSEAGLLLPTTLAPSIPADMLRRAAQGRAGALRVVVTPGRVIGFAASTDAVDPGWLVAFAGREPT